MRNGAGWTLPEVLLVSALTAVALLIVSGTLASTARWTRLESQRGFARGQLQSSLAELESWLQRSCSAGVAYQPPSGSLPGVLAMHLQDPAAYSTTPLWEAHWTCLSWSPVRQELRQFVCPPVPAGVSPPRTQLPILPTPAQFAQIASSNSGRRRLLASDVTNFE